MSKREITVNLDQLLFDPDNPRLPEGISSSQDDIFDYIVHSIQVTDLYDAILSGGFIKGDPIIVREAPEKTGHYFVIEGNRRLAALKLISGERSSKNPLSPAITNVPEDIADSIKEVLVEIGWESNALRNYLGYKHVTSSKEWSPEAKARFVLFHSNGKLDNESLSKFAKQLGTRPSTLKSWLTTLLILKQAEDRKLFDPDNVNSKRYFGTLYTLLRNEAYQDFIGLTSTEVTMTPIPQDKFDNVRCLLTWVTGTRDTKPVLNSRDEKNFAEILRSEAALDYFKRTEDVEGALFYTENKANEIALVFRNSSYDLERSLPKLIDVKGNGDVIASYKLLMNAFNKVKINMGKLLNAK